MNPAIQTMLKKYTLSDTRSLENALKEIIQEIALLGLWRAKFFEHAAFYGGTALRLMYGLDRFSEDLDFTLVTPNNAFNLAQYHQAVREELQSFDFLVRITEKENKKNPQNATIQSAFIKADTLIHDLIVELGKGWRSLPHKILKVKFEVDTQPPPHFSTETHYLLQPTEFFVRTVAKPDLFAGKLHALLCRKWQTRVKGRDWYDWVWFVKEGIPVHVLHLESRMKQSGHLQPHDILTKDLLQEKLLERIDQVPFERMLDDVRPFIKDPRRLDIWSKAFFRTLVEKMVFS